MRDKSQQLRKRLAKKAKRGFRGYPLATIAAYGPDDQRASKLVVSIVERENADPSVMRKWFATDGDVRHDSEILTDVTAFLADHGVLSVGMLDRIIGCPMRKASTMRGRPALNARSGPAVIGGPVNACSNGYPNSPSNGEGNA